MFFNTSSETWMIDIFVMCDYRIQRFSFLNFERHAVLLSVISSKFEKYSIFQHQIAKHAIVKTTSCR